MLLDIRPDHLKIVQDILQKFVPEREVWAFGSRAKWLAKEYSDLDLCILGKTPLSFRALGLLEEAFDDSDLPYKVDVVDWATTSEGFRKIIERDKVVVQKVGRGMSSESLVLSDIAAPIKNAIVGGPFGSNLVSKDYVEHGVPVIRGQNMGDKWVSGEFVYVSEEKAQALSQNTARPGDLVFTQRGTLGQVSIVQRGRFDKYIISQSQMKITVDPEKADVTFLYYLFKTPEQLQYIFNSAIQTGVPHTNLGILKATPVQLPPLSVQKQISAVMNCLDDRITLLRETNVTLEAIAQALFKSWFVDFDPVHAKQQGRAPEGMDEATAALFPDSFEVSELGLVPKGWKPQRLEAFIELAYGKALKSTDRTRGNVPVYGSGGITGYHNESLTNGPSVIVGRKGTVGSLYWEDLPFFPIDTVFYVRSAVPMTYCFYLLKTLGLVDMNTDAAVPGLNRNNVYRLPVVLPPNDVLNAFDDMVKVIRDSIFRNQQQAQTLATLRNTLLPRLISGQLRLPEAEALIEEIA